MLNRPPHRTFFAAVLAIAPLFTAPLAAQDPFELEVYPARTAAAGEWELDTRASYVARGGMLSDGLVAPTMHQSRFTFELTHGITRHVEASAYGLAAIRPGSGAESAGWRLQLRAHAPDAWRLPVDLGLSVEAGHTAARYSDHTYAVEVSPIVGREWGPVAIAVNARLERGLGGTADGEWEFEPAASVQLRVSRTLALRTDYFSSLGPLDALAPAAAQAHLLFPGISLRLGDDVEWDAAVGIGLSPASDALTLKTGVEFPLRD